MKHERLRPHLDELYARYNRAEFIDPDPLSPVRRYSDARDQEIAGLIAAALAFGNVKSIMASIERVFAVLPNPGDDLMRMPADDLRTRLGGFRHRFTTGEEMADLLIGARKAIIAHGSLGDAFAACVQAEHETIVPALAAWVDMLCPAGAPARKFLLTDPRRGSTCKRMLMYLRWMIRRDDVDLGAWPGIDARLLVAPLDTHMFRIARALGFTKRKSPNLAAALETTAALRRIAPEDPVRYDFALTRLGIRSDGDMQTFLRDCRTRLV